MQLAAADGIMFSMEPTMNERIVSAIMKHTAWGVEGLRLEAPETDKELSERIVELLVASLALDDAALVDFIALVMETRASMKAIMADAERCNWPEPIV
jgi:hypothetical protein